MVTQQDTDFSIDASLLKTLPSEIRRFQSEFNKTGGLHASALFDKTGKILVLREDVGRHNALDKLIGSLRNTPELNPRNCGVLLSGRGSFELMQKSAIAGFPLVATVGPPSSLAIDLARDQEITLVGFLRPQSFNVYHGSRVSCD